MAHRLTKQEIEQELEETSFDGEFRSEEADHLNEEAAYESLERVLQQEIQERYFEPYDLRGRWLEEDLFEFLNAGPDEGPGSNAVY